MLHNNVLDNICISVNKKKLNKQLSTKIKKKVGITKNYVKGGTKQK